jgi:hypothetical protein
MEGKETGMRRFLMPALLVGAAVAALTLGAASATADDNGATITKDFGCFVFVAPIAALTHDQSIDIDTSSGNTNLICHFTAEDFVGPLPTATVRLTDVPCTTFAGVGTGSGVFNKNGNGVFKCQIRAT